MGWAPTREGNEITNERDGRDGKPVARQLEPMIVLFSIKSSPTADLTVSRGRPQSALADATAQSRQNERPKWGVEGVTVIGFFQHY